MEFVVRRARRGVLKRNQWRFLIVAENGKKLASSETYNNRADAVSAVWSIRNQAAGAAVRIEE